METSLYLAQYIGIVMAVMGVYILLFPAKLQDVLTEFLNSPALMFVGGITALMLGVAILLSHNVWVMGWPVIITLFGWLAAFAGVLRLTMGEGLRDWGLAMIENRAFMVIDAIIMVGLGAFLIGKGFGWT